jgi:hypothetical protein
VTLGEPDNWSVSGVFRFQTGAPYTPTMPASLTLQQTYFVQNSSNKPYQWNANLKGEKIISLSDLKFTLFIQIDNLFDTENAVDVYSNSGSALYNANQVANPAEFLGTTQRIDRGDPGLIPREAIDKYYVNPANVSRPRLVRLGMSLYL